MEDRPEPLTKEETDAILKSMESLLVSTQKFGVTLKQDYNGAWGQAGNTYLTLRWGKNFEVQFILNSVLDHAIEDRARYDREVPQ